MKQLTNESLQTLEVYLEYPNRIKTVFLHPKTTIVVPSNSITNQCRILSKRKVLTIRPA